MFPSLFRDDVRWLFPKLCIDVLDPSAQLIGYSILRHAHSSCHGNFFYDAVLSRRRLELLPPTVLPLHRYSSHVAAA